MRLLYIPEESRERNRDEDDQGRIENRRDAKKVKGTLRRGGM